MSCEGKLGEPAGSNTACRVLVSHRLQCDFEDFAVRVGRLYGVCLPIVKFEGSPVNDLKKFCGGLLEPSGRHPWASVLRECLPAVDRLSIAGSLFSFRKLLPSDDVDIHAYASKMSTPAPRSSRKFLRFCTKELRKMFRRGWDRRWREFVLQTVPSGSACLTTGRSKGGARSELAGRRDWFLRSAYGLNDFTIPSVRKLGRITTNGKQRIVSSSPWESVVLSPLHRLIYSRLSKFDWLLRGEADPGQFSAFTKKEGEVFVSGDYESATDNLKLDVAIHILSEILSATQYVPGTICREAIASLRCLIDDGELHMQARGQLMGSFLSFPLLCLQNYLAFRFFCGPTVPVRINGDDIVFRARPNVYERWAEGISSTGLTLSKGKTFIHRRMFCLNSKYFRARTVNEPVIVPILRASCLYQSCSDPNQIAGWANRIGEGFSPSLRDDLQVAVLRRHRSKIMCAQRSLTRGLGVNVSASTVTRAGFRNWEGFYLGLPVETHPPQKSTFGSLPPGWAKVSCPLGGTDDPGFQSACVQQAWKVSSVRWNNDDYWTSVRVGTVAPPNRNGAWWRRACRLLKLGRNEASRYLRPHLVPCRVAKRVWRFQDG